MRGAVVVKPIKPPKSSSTADQCREMGLMVGDVIQGRNTFGKHWSESRLMLLTLGKTVVVFRELRRNDQQPDWRDNGKSANWMLNCRVWHKLENDI